MYYSEGPAIYVENLGFRYFIYFSLFTPYTTGKFAMLVAGWEGVDTARASKVLKEGTPALSGQKVLLNTATSTVTVITA